MKRLVVPYFELVFWVTALLLLGLSDPTKHHFTLCPLENLGITWCPGCGIGRAIAHLFTGEVLKSINAHWFGIPALLIIVGRIYSLSGRFIGKLKFSNFKILGGKEHV